MAHTRLGTYVRVNVINDEEHPQYKAMKYGMLYALRKCMLADKPEGEMFEFSDGLTIEGEICHSFFVKLDELHFLEIGGRKERAQLLIWKLNGNLDDYPVKYFKHENDLLKTYERNDFVYITEFSSKNIWGEIIRLRGVLATSSSE